MFTSAPESKRSVRFAPRWAASKIQCCRKLKMHRMKYLIPRQGLICFSLRHALSKHKVVENKKNARNYFRLTLNTKVKSNLYTLTTYLRGPNLCLFRSTIRRFRDSSLLKSEIHWVTSEWTLNGQTYPVYTYPRCPNFCPLHSTARHFQDRAEFTISHWLPCKTSKKKNKKTISKSKT